MGLNLVFRRAFHLILMHLVCYIQCFEVRFQKIWFFSQKCCFFPNFNWSNLFFDQSKFCLKIYGSLCLVWLIEPVFRSIKDRISSFLKTVLWLFQKYLFQKFFKNLVFLSKSCFFQNFNWSNLFFDQSKFCFKIYVSLCLVRLIEPDFRSMKIIFQVF